MMDWIAETKSQLRLVSDALEDTKAQSELQRKETDECNLVRQSCLYEQINYSKEINDCQQTKTPNLDAVLGSGNKPEHAQLKNVDLSGLSEASFKELMTYLDEMLIERMKLARELQQARETKRAKELEYEKKQQFLNNLPQILRTLEDATLPLQDYLSVSLTRDARDAQVLSRLPIPLAVLFEKFTSFTANYPQFALKVGVKGDAVLADEFRLKYDSQLMANPVRQVIPHKSKRMQTEPSLINQSKPVEERATELKLPVDGDDNEEGLILDAEAYEASLNSDFEDPKATESLLGKFAKYPEYVQIRAAQNPNMFKFEQIFKQYSRFTLTHFLTPEDRKQILQSYFPLTMRFFLLPDLNVLTVQLVSTTHTTQKLLANLFSDRDLGQQLRIEETEEITARTNERMFKWVHSLADLKLAFPHGPV